MMDDDAGPGGRGGGGWRGGAASWAYRTLLVQVLYSCRLVVLPAAVPRPSVVPPDGPSPLAVSRLVRCGTLSHRRVCGAEIRITQVTNFITLGYPGLSLNLRITGDVTFFQITQSGA